MTTPEFVLLIGGISCLMLGLRFYLRARVAVGLKLPNKIDPRSWNGGDLDGLVGEGIVPNQVRRDYLRYLACVVLVGGCWSALAVLSGHWALSIALSLVTAIGVIVYLRRRHQYEGRR